MTVNLLTESASESAHRIRLCAKKGMSANPPALTPTVRCAKIWMSATPPALTPAVQ